MKFGFIGLGNMASAIIKGMVASGQYEAANIFGFNRSTAKTENLATNYGITASTSIETLVQAVDVVVLSVKPQMLPDVLPLIRPLLRPEQIIISIAAGKPLAYFQEQLGEDVSIIRVMPNINATIGASTSCFSTLPTATIEQKQIVQQMFATVGSIIELPEHQFSIFTSIACSSPAFSYLYIDSLARAAVKEGMPKQLALEIAASSVLGSAKMVLQSEEHPWTLIDQVCSPGGTTIEGVTSLQVNHFESTIYEAVDAVTSKDRTLAKTK